MLGAPSSRVSDGAVANLNEFENKALPLIYHRVGKTANNTGITALDVRANPEDARQRALYASIANFSSNAVQIEVELLLDNRLIVDRLKDLMNEQEFIAVAAGTAAPAN